MNVQPKLPEIHNEDVSNFLHSFLYLEEPEKPAISEEFLGKVLSILETNIFPTEKKEVVSSRDLEFYFIQLEKLERCAKKSSNYSFEKTVILFHKHFEAISKKGYGINDINTSRDQYNQTSIGWAFTHKAPVLLSALIKAGADVNCGTLEKIGDEIVKKSPLHLLNENRSVYTYWMDSQISANITVQCVSILLNNGCDANAKCVEGDAQERTPLCFAATFGIESIVKLLVKGKADINLEFDDGYFGFFRPLDFAAAQCQDGSPMINLFISLGADFFAVGNGHETAEMIAKRLKNLKTVKTLNDAKMAFIKETHSVLSSSIRINDLIDIIISYLDGPKIDPKLLKVKDVDETSKS